MFAATQSGPALLQTQIPTFETIPDFMMEHKAISLAEALLLEGASIEVSICLEVSKG